MKVDVAVEVTSEPVHECHGAVIALRDRAAIQSCARWRIGTVLPDGRLHRPEKYAKQAADHLGVEPLRDPAFGDDSRKCHLTRFGIDSTH